jgi:hypothetical protein
VIAAMDGYLVCFCLGASGLGLMALGGLGAHKPGHDNDVGSVPLPGSGHVAGHVTGHAAGHGAGHGAGPLAGHAAGHGAGPLAGHAAGHGVPLLKGGALPKDGPAAHDPAPASALALHSARGLAKHAGGRAAGPRGALAGYLLAWLSPRVLFTVLVGLGATGLLARPLLAGAWLFAAALAGGVGFERLIVAPFWGFLMRFGSHPARTLDSAIFEEARAATHFDARGEGLIAVELDGHFVQVLGTLRADQRGAGPRVRAGDRLLIEEVDVERNRCTVSRR